MDELDKNVQKCQAQWVQCVVLSSSIRAGAMRGQQADHESTGKIERDLNRIDRFTSASTGFLFFVSDVFALSHCVSLSACLSVSSVARQEIYCGTFSTLHFLLSFLFLYLQLAHTNTQTRVDHSCLLKYT